MDFVEDLSTLSDEELLAYHDYLQKQETLNDLYQQAMKILINSLYGALGTPTFRYFDLRLASAVTSTGRVMIKYIERVLNEHFNKLFGTDEDYVVAIDTDAVYLNLKRVVDAMATPEQQKDIQRTTTALDVYCKHEIEPLIHRAYQELSARMNSVRNRMVMKREVIATSAIWRAKKNYIMYVIDNEGVRYTEPYIKTMGVETARGATPEFVKEALTKCYEYMLNGTEDQLQSYIETFRQEYRKKDYREIASSLGCNNIEKYQEGDGWVSGTPYNVKAAITFNRMLKKTGSIGYQPIRSGDKIRLLKLIEPNPFGNDMIAYIDHLPKEWEFHRYISRKSMYEKTFLIPVQSFTNHIGWYTAPMLPKGNIFERQNE